MNREIKFRAWSKETEKMSDWDFINSVGNFSKLLILAHVIIMQYTGITDKNGKDIYEGDVLKAVDSEDEGNGWSSKVKVKGVVEYDVQWGYRFQLKDHTQRLLNLYSLEKKSFEIIGNIYENPELLK